MIYSIRPYCFIFLYTVLFSACRIPHDSGMPASRVPVAFRGQAAGDSTGIAEMSWKSFFTDTTLQRLITEAISKNSDMQAALKNISIAEQSLRQARVLWLPAISANAGASTNMPSENSLNGSLTKQFLGTDHIEDFTLNLGMSWEIGIWGKIRGQKRAAFAEYLQTSEARKAIQTRIVASVSQSYYTLLMLDAQLETARRNLALADSTLFMMGLQYNSGQLSALGMQQAEARKLAVAQLIPQLEQNITMQENALSVLSGSFPAAVGRSQKLMDIELPETLNAGVPAAMVGRRPDIRQAELTLRAANERVGIARADFYPSLTLSASSGLNAFKAANWISIPASVFATAAGSLTQPVFRHRQVKTRYEIAKAERDKAAISFRQSVLNAAGEVSDALIKNQKLAEQKSIAETRRDILKKSLTDAGLLFNNGMATYLEVITAQGNALQSELELAAIRHAQLNAATDLYRSLGGGWE